MGQIVTILDALTKAEVAFVALKENIQVEAGGFWRGARHDVAPQGRALRVGERTSGLPRGAASAADVGGAAVVLERSADSTSLIRRR